MLSQAALDHVQELLTELRGSWARLESLDRFAETELKRVAKIEVVNVQTAAQVSRIVEARRHVEEAIDELERIVDTIPKPPGA